MRSRLCTIARSDVAITKAGWQAKVRPSTCAPRTAVRAVTVGTAFIAALALVGPAPSVQAEEPVDYYTETTLDGSFYAAPLPFSVSVQGPGPVCSMTFDGQTRTAPPWDFTFPLDLPGSVGTGQLTTCSGVEATFDAYQRQAFTIPSKSIYVDAQGTPEPIAVQNHTPTPATVTVTDPSGTIVSTTPLPAFQRVTVQLPRKSITKTGWYSVTVSDGAALTLKQSVLLSKGWFTNTSLHGPTPAFTPCSTITWSYDPAGQPAFAATTHRDVEAAVSRLARLSGARFAETAPGSSQIPITWAAFPSTGSNGTAAAGGRIVLNSRNRGFSSANAGFGPGTKYGSRRGWILVHDLLISLGLGITNDPKQLTNYVTLASGMGHGDREGLRMLYPRGTCPAAATH